MGPGPLAGQVNNCVSWVGCKAVHGLRLAAGGRAAGPGAWVWCDGCFVPNARPRPGPPRPAPPFAGGSSSKTKFDNEPGVRIKPARADSRSPDRKRRKRGGIRRKRGRSRSRSPAAAGAGGPARARSRSASPGRKRPARWGGREGGGLCKPVWALCSCLWRQAVACGFVVQPTGGGRGLGSSWSPPPSAPWCCATALAPSHNETMAHARAQPAASPVQQLLARAAPAPRARWCCCCVGLQGRRAPYPKLSPVHDNKLVLLPAGWHPRPHPCTAGSGHPPFPCVCVGRRGRAVLISAPDPATRRLPVQEPLPA